MDCRIIAAVSDQPHTCGDRVQIRQRHVSCCEHPAVTVDKGYHRSNQMPVWNPGGNGDNWQDRDIQEQAVQRDLRRGLDNRRQLTAGKTHKKRSSYGKHRAGKPQKQGKQSAHRQLAKQQSRE